MLGKQCRKGGSRRSPQRGTGGGGGSPHSLHVGDVLPGEWFPVALSELKGRKAMQCVCFSSSLSPCSFPQAQGQLLLFQCTWKFQENLFKGLNILFCVWFNKSGANGWPAPDSSNQCCLIAFVITGYGRF